MRLKSSHLIASAAMLGIAGVAGAAQQTTQFNVTATVLQNCAVSATDVAFGAYIPSTGDINANSSVDVACTAGVNYSVNLDGGASGDPLNRYMNGPAPSTVLYQLYTDAARTNIWDDGTTSNNAGLGTGMGNPVSYTVYGTLLDSGASLLAVDGAYSDVITVTVVY
jgi:spore coat protein U domain-containing protein, fimbrial subunit CupE1/2/3/6